MGVDTRSELTGVSGAARRLATAVRPGSAIITHSRVVDLGLRRAGAGLFLAASCQSTVGTIVARDVYGELFVFLIHPLFILLLATTAIGLLTTAWPTQSVVAACVVVAAFSVVATVFVHDESTGATNVVEPLVGHGAFGSAMSPRPAARAAAAGLIVIHRTALAVAGTGPITAHLGFALLELGLFGAALVGCAWCRRLALPLDAAEAALSQAAAADAVRDVANAAQRERARLLHDAVLLTLAMVGQAVVPDSPAVRERCEREARILRGNTAMWRRDVSLPAGLDSLVASFRGRGMDVAVHHGDRDAYPTEPRVVTALLRSVQEALTNVLHHSGEREAVVRVVAGPAGVSLTVSDRGRGFHPDGLPATGLGLRRSIMERLHDLGGAIEVSSTPGRGTTVVARWPG